MDATTTPTPYVLKQVDGIAVLPSSTRDGSVSPDNDPADGKDKRALESDDEKEDVPPTTPSEVEDGVVAPPYIPWKWKVLALLTAISLSSGQEWTNGAIGPLKNTLRNELKINNTQFAIIDSASSVVNTVWPIVGGMATDWFGVSTISLICTGTSLLGAVIAALGPTLGIWRMIVGGHILLGFGTAVLDGCQHKLFYHWFGNSGLALAYGIESAFSGSTSLVSGVSAIPIKEGTGWYGWSLWIPVVICFFSFSMNLAYVAANKWWIPAQFRLVGAKDAVLAPGQPKRRFDFLALKRIPWAFWILPMTQLFQSEAAGAFDSSASDLIRMKGYTEAVSAYTAQGKKVLPILLTPIIGYSADRWGHRPHLMAAAPIFWCIALAVIGWTDVHPLLPVVIASLAGTINAFPFAISMPLMLREQTILGTGFGVWRCFNNSGSTTMSIIYGRVQDATADMSYINVLKIGLGFKCFAFFLGLFYIYLDKHYWGSTLTLGVKQRVAAEALITDPENHPLTARPVKKVFTIGGISLWISMAITAIVLFVYYTL